MILNDSHLMKFLLEGERNFNRKFTDIATVD